jgi:sec-independent protein translocase protein TatA
MELVIILLVLVMLFGATRLADLGGSLGKGIKEFRKNVKEEDGDEDEEAEPAKPSTTASASTPPVATPPMATAQNGAETVSAVKCPSCGALNAAEAKHCNQCGAAIAAPVS